MEQSLPERPELSRRKGWYNIHRADVALIIERGADNRKNVSAIALQALWLALNDEADWKGSKSFKAGTAFIARKAGVSKRTAVSGLAVLEDLGLVMQEVNFNKARMQYDQSTWTIRPATTNKAGRKVCTTPSASDEGKNLRNEYSLRVIREGESKDKEGRFPMPDLSVPLPSPLWPKTVEKKKAAIAEMVKQIKRTAQKVPIKIRAADGHEYKTGEFKLEPEAEAALAAWAKQEARITEALAS